MASLHHEIRHVANLGKSIEHDLVSIRDKWSNRWTTISELSVRSTTKLLILGTALLGRG